jgi:carboxylesterase
VIERRSDCDGLPARRRAVLLLHGLCSSTLEVRQFARLLRDQGFDVVTPTLRGYSAADSDAAAVEDSGEPNFRRWIADCIAEVDRLAVTHSEISLCGVSLGATLALAVAAERPNSIAALSLISTTIFFDGWNVSRWRWLLPLAYYTPLGRFYRYRETPPYGVKNARVRAFIARELANGRVSSAGAPTIPTRSLREADRLIRHVKRWLEFVRAPVLLIHAREDDVAGLSNVRFVRQNVGTLRIHEVIVSDSYHMITLDNDRDHAASKTIEFFDSLAGLRLARGGGGGVAVYPP